MSYAFQEAPCPWEGDLAMINEGLLAKVGFAADTCGGEWMWVHVTDVDGDGTHVGVLLNTPWAVDGLDHGDVVAGFDRKHIYEARVDPAFAVVGVQA
jgi:hypothetical protein